MVKLVFISYCFLFILMESNHPHTNHAPSNAKQEILDQEKAFAKMAADSGLTKAFIYFAADSAVLLRGSRLIKGKAEIRHYFSNSSLKEISLNWSAEFVDVAESADMAYTYGPYTFKALDSLGKTIESTGYFHTVWKKQEDGNWRFVWD